MSSVAVLGSASTIRSGGNAPRSASPNCRVTSGSQTTAGTWTIDSTVAVPPPARAMSAAVERTRTCSPCCRSGSIARSVPPSTTSSGMMFAADPADTWVMVTVARPAYAREMSRSATITSAAMATGSTVPRDVAGMPATSRGPRRRSSSLPAHCTPAPIATVPTGMPACRCRPIARSTDSSAPSSIIRSAPTSVSSAGWKQNRARPDQSSRLAARMSATASAIATCPS